MRKALAFGVAMVAMGSQAAMVENVGSISVGQPVSRILADPVRAKVYAFTDTGDVLFINRATMSVEKTISTGRKLTDIDISPDGSMLTVLDNVTREYWNQPPATYLLKFDLSTQSLSGMTFMQSPLFHMALGRNNRIVGVGVNQWVNVYENDATTGAQLSSTGGGYAGSMDWGNITLVSNPAGTKMYRTDTGISSIAVMAFDISTDTIVGAGGRGVGSYATEPVFINSSGSSLYVGDLRLNPDNLSQVMGLFPENIYAATGNDLAAFGSSGFYDPVWGTKLGNMPVSGAQMTIGEHDQYLYVWNSTGNRLNVLHLDIPEPGTTAMMLALVGGFLRRRR